MKKVKIIYNPSSGRQNVRRKIEMIGSILMDNGYLVARFATKGKGDAMNETIKSCSEDWDILIACGGDGTINEVATGIMKGQNKIPVAILATGTVNDFATSMKLPTQPKEFCEMILKRNVIDVDLGKANNNYFVNVLAGGIITNVAHQVPVEMKTLFGRAAYYIAGLREMPRQMLNPFHIEIESEEYSFDGEVLLFLVTNTASIGGFKGLAPSAQVEDGLLDCIIIRKVEILDVIPVFVSLLKGDITTSPNVKHFKTKKMKIKSKEPMQFDMDGEYGGELPVDLEVVPASFRILI